MPPVASTAQSFGELTTKLTRSHSSIRFLYAGDRVKAKTAELIFFWPDTQFVSDKSRQVSGEREKMFLPLRESTTDPNNFSQVFVFSQNKTRILFTGDASAFVLDAVEKGLSEQSLVPVDIFKVPHHGSKKGLTFAFLKLADPALSVISAGKNNPYGHPSGQVLSHFQALKKNYARTDEEGDVAVEIDEEGWRRVR
jgi:competence protein ComEC